MNIQRMTKAELAAEAKRQGQAINEDMTREELIAMLHDPASTKDGFLPPERLSGKKATIHIASTEGPGGADPVPVGLNGKVWAIPRDVEVEIPLELLEGPLKDAVMTVLEPDGKNIDGTIKWKERDVRRFQVQRVH